MRRTHALGLLGLRLVVLTLLWLIVALQPTVSHFDTEMVPSEVLVAVDMSQSMDVADTQYTPAEANGLAGTLRRHAGRGRRLVAQGHRSPHPVTCWARSPRTAGPAPSRGANRL